MRTLIFGAGSYLGRNLLIELKKTKQPVLGLSANRKNSSTIVTDYSKNNLIKIVNEFMPDRIFDFKTYTVSSDESSYPKDYIKYTLINKSIIDALNESLLENTIVNLISTKLLDNDIKSLHPYLKIKKKQEEYYFSFLDERFSLNIFRVPNVLGNGDLNFSRIIPFFFGNYLIGQKNIKFNSKSTNLRKYIFLNELIRNLKLNKIDFDISLVSTNQNLINFFINLIKKQKLYIPEIIWKNNETDLDKIVTTSMEDLHNIENLKNIFNWYLSNKKQVVKSYKTFLNSYEK